MVTIFSSLTIMIFFLIAVTDVTFAEHPPFNAQGEIVGEVSFNSVIIHTRLTLNTERNPTTKTWGKGEYDWLPYSPDLPEEVPGCEGWVRILFGNDKDLQVMRKTEWKHATTNHDFTAQFRLGNLAPDTRYYYRTEMSTTDDHEIMRFGKMQSFKTAPAPNTFSPVDFTVITGTAVRSRDIFKNEAPWGFKSFVAMKDLRPDFFVHTGDNVYYDTDSPLATKKELARFHWHRMHSIPCVMELFRTVPVYFIKDDHDYRWNDCWPQQQVPYEFHGVKSYITDEMGRRLFLEAVPMGDKTHRTFVWGSGLQIWLVEGRDYRSPNTIPDGPEKNIWGKEQKQWLKDSLLKSNSTFKVLISPTPIIGPDRESKRDNHANSRGFKTEGREFLEWVASSGIKNFYIICGDRHWQYQSIDSTGIEEFSCGCVSNVHAAQNQPHWEKDRQPYFRDSYGGFLHVKLCGTKDEPELRMIFRDVDGVPVYVAVKKAK